MLTTRVKNSAHEACGGGGGGTVRVCKNTKSVVEKEK